MTVEAVTAGQRGLITRGQLHEAALTDSAVAHRVRTGALHRIHRGVYALGRPDLGPLGAETAAP